MDKTDVSSVLRELAAGDSSRSETARLRDVYDDVEAALAAGVSRAAILEKLKENGFTMTLKSFESALYRIRKQRASGKAGHKRAAESIPSKPPLGTGKGAETVAEPAPEGSAGTDTGKRLDAIEASKQTAERYIGTEGQPRRRSILNKTKE